MSTESVLSPAKRIRSNGWWRNKAEPRCSFVVKVKNGARLGSCLGAGGQSQAGAERGTGTAPSPWILPGHQESLVLLITGLFMASFSSHPKPLNAALVTETPPTSWAYFASKGAHSAQQLWHPQNPAHSLGFATIRAALTPLHQLGLSASHMQFIIPQLMHLP